MKTNFVPPTQLKRKVLSDRWYSQADPKFPIIGIIAAETDAHLPEAERTWCAYIGTGKSIVLDYVLPEQLGSTQEQDRQHICNNGGKLQREEAAGIFPHLDIAKYKIQ